MASAVDSLDAVDKVTDGMMSNTGKVVVKAGATTYDIILVLLFIGLGVAIIFLIYKILSHKHNIIIKEVSNRRYRVFMDKYKYVVKDGVEKIHLFKRRCYINPPPSGAVEITNKGKEFCTVYHVVEAGRKNGYTFQMDEAIDFDDDDNVKKKMVLLSSEDREAIIEQERKLWDKKRKGWKELIPVISAIAVVIPMIIAFAFFGESMDRTNTALENVATITASQAKLNAETANILRIVTEQGMFSNITGGGQEIPLDAKYGVTT